MRGDRDQEMDSNNNPQPAGKRRRSLFTTLLKAGLVTALLFVIGVFIAGYMYLHTTPQGLYHRAWQTAPAFAYDQAAYKDWPSYEHKYDSSIHNDADAIKYANETLGTLKDPYTRLEDPQEVAQEDLAASGQLTGIGISLRVKLDAQHEMVKDAQGQPLAETDHNGFPVIKEVRDGGPAKGAGLRNGDAITSVDGVSTKNITIDSLIKKIRGEAGTSLTLGINRNGQDLPPLSITRAVLHIPAVTTKNLPDNIGYIKLESFEQNDGDQEMAAALQQLSQSRALILDLRGNPGGQVDQAIKMASLFLDRGTVVSIKTRVPFGDYETTTYSLTTTDLVETKEEGGKTTTTSTTRIANQSGHKPLIILVDGGSASAAEMFTGALKDNGRAVIVGEKTFGKGIGQTVLPFANGTRLRVTTLHYFTPNGTWLGDAGITVSTGITPDHVVKADKGLEIGTDNDNQLEAAQRLF